MTTLEEQQTRDRQLYGPIQAWWWWGIGRNDRTLRRLIAELRIALYKARLGPEWIDTRYDVPRLMRGDHIIGTVGE